MSEARKLKLKANQVYTEWANENIYINEQQTHSNRNLYKQKQRLKRVVINLLGLKMLKLLLKKNETCNVIFIEDENSILKIV